MEEQPVRELPRRPAVEAPRDCGRQGDSRGNSVQSVWPRARCHPGARRISVCNAAAPGTDVVAVDARHGGATDPRSTVRMRTFSVARRFLLGVAVLTAASLGAVEALQMRGSAAPGRSAQTTRARARAAWPPPVHKTPIQAPFLTAEEELKTIVVPPGYHVHVVAKEPLVKDPIWIDFDAAGRMWVLEMPGFMPDTSGKDSREPINDLVVLEDTDGDGVMDKRTVFADKLALPRALKVLDEGRVLVGEPPNLWLMQDTDGDLVVDSKVLLNSL